MGEFCTVSITAGCIGVLMADGCKWRYLVFEGIIRYWEQVIRFDDGYDRAWLAMGYGISALMAVCFDGTQLLFPKVR